MSVRLMRALREGRRSATCSDCEDARVRWNVVIPVNPHATAKSRLADLPTEARRELATAFAADVVTMVLASPLVSRVIIIGTLPTHELDGHVGDRLDILDDPGGGLLPAIRHGLQTLSTTDAVCVMVSDIPAARTADLTLALNAAAEVSSATSIISDAEGIGTTTYLSRHAELARPRFGPRSRAAHVHDGAIDLLDLDVPGLRRDVDTTVDLWDAQRLGVAATTARALQRLGLSLT
jgi:2-phospho-L-lactate/phosphoenolpyruvate guanylyltransferase